MKPDRRHATKFDPTHAAASTCALLPIGMAAALEPSMIMCWSGGHAFGASHCCPDADVVVCTPAGWRRPDASNAPIARGRFGSSGGRQPAHSGSQLAADVPAHEIWRSSFAW